MRQQNVAEDSFPEHRTSMEITGAGVRFFPGRALVRQARAKTG